MEERGKGLAGRGVGGVGCVLLLTGGREIEDLDTEEYFI